MIRGELAIGRGRIAPTHLYAVDRWDPDHDAVMRIGGKAPRRQAHSLRRRASHACLGSPPPRIVINALPVLATGAEFLGIALMSTGRLLRRTQDDAGGDLAGGHQTPECDQQLARQRDNQGLAGGAAGIGGARPVPLR